MSEIVCGRCHRVCFSDQQYREHSCFDMDDKLDAEIAVCNWNGALYGEARNIDAAIKRDRLRSVGVNRREDE